MRTLLSLLLVMLLVLRGLAGNAMAMDMAPGTAPMAGEAHAHPVAALAADTAPDAHHAHGAPASHGHSTDHNTDVAAAVPHASDNTCHAPSGGDTSDNSDCGHSHGAGCSACGICHSSLSSPNGLIAPLPSPTGSLQPLCSARFASAPAALAFKPPIS